jgi:hypothetical protein
MNRPLGWILLTVMMFIAGVGIGLVVAWGILPVRLADTSPQTLMQSAKDRYRVLIAEDYLVTGDDERARARLTLVDGQDELMALTIQVTGKSWSRDAEGNALTKLLLDLKGARIEQPQQADLSTVTPTPLVYLQESATPHAPNQVSTSTPLNSLTEASSETPSHYLVLNRTPICKNDQASPIIEITVVDVFGRPRKGVVIIVSSPEGTERIITGLNPGAPAGFADLVMKRDLEYVIKVEGKAGGPESITTFLCESPGGGSYPGGWSLQIQF